MERGVAAGVGRGEVRQVSCRQRRGREARGLRCGAGSEAPGLRQRGGRQYEKVEAGDKEVEVGGVAVEGGQLGGGRQEGGAAADVKVWRMTTLKRNPKT